MKVLSSLIQEEDEKIIRCVLEAIGLGFTSNLAEKSIKLIFGEELWNVTN